MGFNTVAVLYNDFDFTKQQHLGERIQSAMRSWPDRDRIQLGANFGCGIVISQAHADYTQVVVVGRNTGYPISEATDLDWYALNQIKACLEANGYRVVKKRKPKGAALPSQDGDDRG